MFDSMFFKAPKYSPLYYFKQDIQYYVRRWDAQYYPCFSIYLVACLEASRPFDGSTGLIEEVLEVPGGSEADAVIARYCNQEAQG